MSETAEQGQPTRLVRTYDTSRGPVKVAINRRGATTSWTAADDEAMATVVRAVIESPTTIVFDAPLPVEGERDA